ncbi:uncharacterized protein LOC101889766 [Musca domestica]|uniref:Uncharacterized protein LOC101889766 n=2 Tax=Musca domestica TaxID=7370 RepID=A0A1I8N444_MUSDO|nr:uncharacterized protein LOC101889766 [Musca domestica]
MANIKGLWERFVYKFLQFAPSIVVCLSFLPCGLVFGYTISSFVAERDVDSGVIVYGPLILGACWGFVAAMIMFFVKFFRSRIVFWHMYILLVAGVFHFISSCFYFADDLDNVGAFISYLGHSLTFLAGLSFLHTILSKGTRALFMAIAFSFYILGMASAVSLIGTSYTKNAMENSNGTPQELIHGIYVDFAGVYLSMSVVVLALLIGIVVLNYFGTTDSENSLDNDLRIANSNGSIFDKRDEIIKRIEFFYVTKNQQWNVTLLLIFTEAIQYSLFIYFAFWFSLNNAVRVTDILNIDLMFWVIYAGSALVLIPLVFVSVKVTFVANQLCLIVLTILSMIICNSVKTSVPFWLVLFFFGMTFSNLQILLVEVAHFRYLELLIYVSYLLKLLSTSVIYYYFVANAKNSYFYSTDISTLMSQGFVFIIIGSLLALVVGMKVPRTHRTSLFEIQYGLLGIIFQKHQIEQLNVRCLNDGTIPTISREEY